MAKANKSFEESVGRLEEIVRMLENGTATLDESLKLYEEGIALVRACNKQLDNAEKKILHTVFFKKSIIIKIMLLYVFS